jgi:hypothetical protein
MWYVGKQQFLILEVDLGHDREEIVLIVLMFLFVALANLFLRKKLLFQENIDLVLFWEKIVLLLNDHLLIFSNFFDMLLFFPLKH